jgi:hypothetical protein
MKISTVTFCFFLLLVQYGSVFGQYPPPAGQPGSTAIYKDSTIFIGWATECTVSLGYINLADTTVYFQGSNRANYGVPEDATGKPDYKVISLGDGGEAILTFEKPLLNGPGFDFAIFENSFSDTFLELGFVEVSSDGITFVRFPSVSLTQTVTQISAFGEIDATKINNFAGKYRAAYGTPFDLDELKDSAGINVNQVTHVRIIDAVGCIQPPYARYDSQGNIVNDPWPTPFNTCGLDLDAVGVIHFATSVEDTGNIPEVTVFPNPCDRELNIVLPNPGAVLTLTGTAGIILLHQRLSNKRTSIDVSSFSPGLYFARIVMDDGSAGCRKIMIR